MATYSVFLKAKQQGKFFASLSGAKAYANKLGGQYNVPVKVYRENLETDTSEHMYTANSLPRPKRIRRESNPSASGWIKARAVRIRKVGGRLVADILTTGRAAVAGGRSAGARRNPAGADTSAARELQLYIESDSGLYRQQYQPILKNLATKKARGIYVHTKAVKLFGYLVESGAKKYVKEYGGQSWHDMFNVPTRKIVAENLTDSFETGYDYGNYDNMLPKKYQK
jgi:hypothetical protein